MTYVLICDICKKKIKEREVRVRSDLDAKEYCKKCWQNNKNWERIHAIKPED